MLRALGHRHIIVLDTSATKREAALQAGAAAALDNSRDTIVSEVANAAGGALQSAIDFVNNAQTVAVAFECLGKGGKLVLIGVGGGEYKLSLAGLIFRPRSIIGSITGSREDLRDVIALAQSGKLAAVPVTRMPSNEANQALQRLAEGEVVGRIVLSAQA